jgi:hypothetical protein
MSQRLRSKAELAGRKLGLRAPSGVPWPGTPVLGALWADASFSSGGYRLRAKSKYLTQSADQARSQGTGAQHSGVLQARR